MGFIRYFCLGLSIVGVIDAADYSSEALYAQVKSSSRLLDIVGVKRSLRAAEASYNTSTQFVATCTPHPNKTKNSALLWELDFDRKQRFLEESSRMTKFGRAGGMACLIGLFFYSVHNVRSLWPVSVVSALALWWVGRDAWQTYQSSKKVLVGNQNNKKKEMSFEDFQGELIAYVTAWERVASQNISKGEPPFAKRNYWNPRAFKKNRPVEE
jgi:hypothetical protein